MSPDDDNRVSRQIYSTGVIVWEKGGARRERECTSVTVSHEVWE